MHKDRFPHVGLRKSSFSAYVSRGGLRFVTEFGTISVSFTESIRGSFIYSTLYSHGLLVFIISGGARLLTFGGLLYNSVGQV